MAMTVWLTGLSGAGKSTLARALCEELIAAGRPAQLIDGDHLRTGLCADLGFSKADRVENIRRAAHVCHMLNMAGVVAVAALISPYREGRDAARAIIGEHRFHEVWLATGLAVCEERDPKGLYKRARRGEIENFTGVSDVYEPPHAPQLRLDTAALSVSQSMSLLRKLCELKQEPV